MWVKKLFKTKKEINTKKENNYNYLQIGKKRLPKKQDDKEKIQQ